MHKVMHACFAFFPKDFWGKERLSNMIGEPCLPRRDINCLTWSENVIFQVELKELNRTCEETCYRKVPVIKDFSLLSLLPNTHRKNDTKSLSDTYILLNDNTFHLQEIQRVQKFKFLCSWWNLVNCNGDISLWSNK